MRLTVLTGFVLLTHVVAAQSSFLPQGLGSPVNSSYHEINPVLSPDGTTLYFVRVNHPENTYGAADSEDIWYSILLHDSTWSDPQRIPELNIGRYNAVLSVSGDGNTLLLNGVYNRKGNIWKKRGLSLSHRNGDEWGTPERLKIKKFSKVNRGLRSSASLSADGESMVLSYSKTFNGNRNNLYYSRRKKNGNWSRPVKLARVNSGARDEAPFLAPDGETLYFASNRKSRNNFNIYKATKTGTGLKDWSKPVALSDTVNSPSWESYFKTNSSGNWGYYSSTGGTASNADLFRVKLFEENPYVVIKGRVVNAVTKAPLFGQRVAITVNGLVPDSLHVDFDSATYELTLKLGDVYTISASVDKSNPPTPVTVDVSKVKEFTTRRLDLPVAALPYVLVTGRLLVQESGMPVERIYNPRVMVNNANDPLPIDVQAGTYEVRLEPGAIHKLKLIADEHITIEKTLDLTTVSADEKVHVNLFVTVGAN